jgi:hypothetical protein
MADIPLVSPQLLTLRAADDPICRVAEIIAELAHPLSEPIVPELPEADGVPAVTHRARIPPALMPGVRQGTHHPGLRPPRALEGDRGPAGGLNPVGPGTQQGTHRLGAPTPADGHLGRIGDGGNEKKSE